MSLRWWKGWYDLFCSTGEDQPEVCIIKSRCPGTFTRIKPKPLTSHLKQSMSLLYNAVSSEDFASQVKAALQNQITMIIWQVQG